MTDPHYPLGDNRVQTHNENCWRYHGHEKCAERKAKELAEALLEALEWNWLDEDFNEAMFDTFTALGNDVLKGRE